MYNTHNYRRSAYIFYDLIWERPGRLPAVTSLWAKGFYMTSLCSWNYLHSKCFQWVILLHHKQGLPSTKHLRCVYYQGGNGCLLTGIPWSHSRRSAFSVRCRNVVEWVAGCGRATDLFQLSKLPKSECALVLWPQLAAVSFHHCQIACVWSWLKCLGLMSWPIATNTQSREKLDFELQQSAV